MPSSYPYGATDPSIYDVDVGYDDDYDPRLDCDHEEYEMDVCTSRCVCELCGYRWYATNEQVEAELDRQAEYWEWAERENRKQWWRDQIDRFAFWRRWRWRWRRPASDDLPF